jgi:hypothetical protein
MENRTLIPGGSPHSRNCRWPKPNQKPSVFTAFVHSQQGSETPDPGLLHDAWSGLQATLCGELKRRGLWYSPPCYLGVYGYERWDAEETVGDPMSHAWCYTRPGQSALAELVTDCWAFIFSDRMQSLKAQLRDKENIDGLVVRNVKNFLHERQRQHDPVGFRIFERLHGALADAVSRQALYVLGGDQRIRNNTVLGFTPEAELRLPALDLGPIVTRWNDELLPGIVTSRGHQEAVVLDRLAQLLLGLPRHGIHCFRVKDLVEPLKSDARQRWAAFLARDDSAGAVQGAPNEVQVLQRALPECAVETRQSFEHLIRCVSAAIDRVDADPRTRGYLAVLWAHLQRQYGDGDPGEAGGGEPGRDDGGESPLSHRQLSQRLQIPRVRIPMLFATLKQVVTRCRLERRRSFGVRSRAARPGSRCGPAPGRARRP